MPLLALAARRLARRAMTSGSLSRGGQVDRGVSVSAKEGGVGIAENDALLRLTDGEGDCLRLR